MSMITITINPRKMLSQPHSTYIMSVLPNEGVLLDIGCGTGLFVERYHKNGGMLSDSI